MEIDLSRSRLTPFRHQVEGIKAIVDNPFFFLGDEMGAGKSKQTIDGAQVLFEQNVIDRVLIVSPASVRGVWFDPELSELQKHLWEDMPAAIMEYHAKICRWQNGPRDAKRKLEITITNYEFLRSKSRFQKLLAFCNLRTLLVLDESSAIKNHKAVQTIAVVQLRKACGRVLLLNGTPVANSPLDMFSQGNIMHPSILDCKYITYFRARYAILEPVRGAGGKALTDLRGNAIMTAVGYQNIEDLQRRFAPYILRRLKKDCLDLPPCLPPVTLYVTLKDETWHYYKEMRDQMLVELKGGDVAVVEQAAVKVMRLSQITSGFIGGIDASLDLDTNDDSIRDLSLLSDRRSTETVIEIGREKLDFLLGWWKDRLIEDPDLKLLTWVRFKPELERMMKEVWEQSRGTELHVGAIYGGQNSTKREENLRLLHPISAPTGAVFFGGTMGTGALGLNFTACHTVVYLSAGYSNFQYEQSLARVDRPGQTVPVSYFNVIAIGPKGQKTIDFFIAKARQEKQELSTWTTSAWIKALEEEG